MSESQGYVSEFGCMVKGPHPTSSDIHLQSTMIWGSYEPGSDRPVLFPDSPAHMRGVGFGGLSVPIADKLRSLYLSVVSFNDEPFNLFTFKTVETGDLARPITVRRTLNPNRTIEVVEWLREPKRDRFWLELCVLTDEEQSKLDEAVGFMDQLVGETAMASYVAQANKPDGGYGTTIVTT